MFHFFFNDAATTELYTLSLHDALPISGATNIAYSELELRYWYTSEGAQAETYSCDYAILNCANIVGQFVKLSTPITGANGYLRVTFGAGAGTLNAGAVSGEIQNRFNKTDWSNYSEADD